MLLTISYNGPNAADLGYLLHKNPYRPQSVELNHGRAHIFYPELTQRRATCALLLDINPVDLARGKVGSGAGGLFDYVNDRPYVSSSFLSTAIARVFGTAMTGRCDKRQALADAALDLEAVVHMLPCRGSRDMLSRVFEPLGYTVSYERFLTDERFSDWGESCYVNLTIKGCVRLSEMLRHLYVLIPVFDRQKHYWVGSAEVEKLLRNGEDWLPGHPERAFIAQGYLNRRRMLINLALERLSEVDDTLAESAEENESAETSAEPRIGLNQRRLDAVLQVLKGSGAETVIDLGCGEGKLMELLIRDRQFRKITGMDVAHSALQRAQTRLHLEDANDSLRERVALMQGSLTYRDKRIEAYQAAVVMEVIEHLDPTRLTAMERVVFEFSKFKTVIFTTPNAEYNRRYENLSPGAMRHPDHRFEWSRQEFRRWAEAVAARYGYSVRYEEIGDGDDELGAPTQMGVFSRCE